MYQPLSSRRQQQQQHKDVVYVKKTLQLSRYFNATAPKFPGVASCAAAELLRHGRVLGEPTQL